MKNNIKKFRQRSKLSLDALSELSGTAKSSLSMIELGETEPKLSTAYRITAALRRNRVESVFPPT